jgi:hypothetical protein
MFGRFFIFEIPLFSCGVTVAQQTLTLLVVVRIHAGKPVNTLWLAPVPPYFPRDI